LNIAKNIFYARQHMPTPLGRWKICENKNINLVVDYANEDHSCACSHYNMEHSTDIRNKLQNKFEQNEENNLYDYDFECLLSNSNSK
jgi:hypothetical protein